MKKNQEIYSIILAGGAGKRLGGGQKANKLLAGKPLIEHIVQRWALLKLPKNQLAINANQEQEQLSQYAYPVFADLDSDNPGPLTGLWSALHWLNVQKHSAQQLLILPCDTPFFPLDLADRLAELDPEKVGVASYLGYLQPTFSLWPRSILPALEKSITCEGMRGFKEFLQTDTYEIYEWPEADINPFLNINSPQDMKNAERQLLRSKLPIQT